MKRKNLRENKLNPIQENDLYLNNTNNFHSKRNLQQEESKIFTIPNQVPLIQAITIKPKKVSRELYEIVLPGVNKKYNLVCKQKNDRRAARKPYVSILIRTRDSVEKLRNMMANLFEDPIVLKKIIINDKNEYISNTATDSSYNDKKPFSSFYNSKQMNYNPINANQAGISLLFFVDNPVGETTNYDIDCNIYSTVKEVNEVKYTINKIQEASSKIDGYYILKIKDENNKIYKTENIPTNTNSLVDYLNKIPFLSNNVELLNSSVDLEFIKYYIRIDLNVNKHFHLKS